MTNNSIYDFGFDISLNIPLKNIGTPTVYDNINDPTIANSILFGNIISGSGNNIFGADPSKGIWLGNALSASAPFSVSQSGALVASSINIMSSSSGQRLTISTTDNFIKFYDSSNNLVATIGGSTTGTGQYLDLVSPSTVDNPVSRIIANNTTGVSASYTIDTKGHQVGISLQNDNTDAYRTSNSVPMIDLRQLGTGSGIRFANNSPNSDGKVFDITQNLTTSTEPIVKITQNGITSTNFRMIWREINTGFTVWVSNGTTPNGNLTGALGDICYNGLNGHTFWCSTAGTTWTQI